MDFTVPTKNRSTASSNNILVECNVAHPKLLQKSIPSQSVYTHSQLEKSAASTSVTNFSSNCNKRNTKFIHKQKDCSLVKIDDESFSNQRHLSLLTNPWVKTTTVLSHHFKNYSHQKHPLTFIDNKKLPNPISQRQEVYRDYPIDKIIPQFLTVSSHSVPPPSQGNSYRYYNDEEFPYLASGDPLVGLQVEDTGGSSEDYWSHKVPQHIEGDDEEEEAFDWRKMMSRSTAADSQRIVYPEDIHSKKVDDSNDDEEEEEDTESWYYNSEEKQIGNYLQDQHIDNQEEEEEDEHLASNQDSLHMYNSLNVEGIENEEEEEEHENAEEEEDEDEGEAEDVYEEKFIDEETYPAYQRYITARSTDANGSLGTMRSDSLQTAQKSKHRDLLSRHDSKGFHQDNQYNVWNRSPGKDIPLMSHEGLDNLIHDVVELEHDDDKIEQEVNDIEEEEEEEEESINMNIEEPSIIEEENDDNEQEILTESLDPYTVTKIDSRIDIRHVPGKGRCVFAKTTFKPGDIIFIESPTLVAIPKLDEPLWEALKELNKTSSFDLPPIWHLAALYSLTRLPKSQQKVIMEKWVPDPNKEPSTDVQNVLNSTNLVVDPYRYERFLQAWRYNSFGHHVETDGLVLYNRISMIAHDCAATASWHYGENDAFVLRARNYIPVGGEITISYIGDDDLFKATHIRQEKLSGWLFTCSCPRCQASNDSARGFRCPGCGAGTTFFKTIKEPDQSVSDGSTTATDCSLCLKKPSRKTIEKYLNFEKAYISRLEETDKQDVTDVELVYSEAQRVFNQHWVLYTLDTFLFEAYRDSARWLEASVHQQLRIKYASQAIPKASYTLAWLYEELGDCHANNISTSFHTSPPLAITGFQKNLLAEKYETAMNILFLLCGPQHDYTTAAHKKLTQVFNCHLAPTE